MPSSPGRIGVFQYLTILGLSLFVIPKAEALGYSVMLHLTTYAPMLGLGTYYLWREKITWQKLEQAVRQVRNRRGAAGAPRRE